MIERIAIFIDSLRISVRAFEQQISASNGLIRKAITNSTDIQSKWLAAIADNYPQLDMNWLLTGRGSMLRNSKNPEETNVGVPSNANPISSAEESVIYMMYKEKDSEVGALKEEIGGLKERIRQLESQDKEPEHHPSVDKVTETFTSDLSGDYGEGFLPTNQPTTSKRLSAGKI